jgi:hypothetical protein
MKTLDHLSREMKKLDEEERGGGEMGTGGEGERGGGRGRMERKKDKKKCKKERRSLIQAL